MNRKAYRFTDLSVPLEERMQTLLNSPNRDPTMQVLIPPHSEESGLYQQARRHRVCYTRLHCHTTLCNRDGTLHGGPACTLFETLTTSALLTIAKAGYWDTLGVSRTLTFNFLRPIPRSIQVSVDCEVVAAGKNMANLRGTMRTADGKVCITCIHDKAAVIRPKL